MKKLLLLFVILPVLGFSQAKFSNEEFMYLHRHADSTNETAFCAECWTYGLANWKNGTSMDSIRAYVDIAADYLYTLDTAGYFIVYNQYGVAETGAKSRMWSMAVGSKLMMNLRQYTITPATSRAVLKDNFISFCKGHVYIRYFK